jgi:hypothetical protein
MRGLLEMSPSATPDLTPAKMSFRSCKRPERTPVRSPSIRPGVGARASRGVAMAGSAKERSGRANNDLYIFMMNEQVSVN